MGRLTRISVVLVCALIMPNCVTMGGGRTQGAENLGLGSRDALSTGDARFDNNEIIEDHIQGAVER